MSSFKEMCLASEELKGYMQSKCNLNTCIASVGVTIPETDQLLSMITEQQKPTVGGAVSILSRLVNEVDFDFSLSRPRAFEKYLLSAWMMNSFKKAWDEDSEKWVSVGKR